MRTEISEEVITRAIKAIIDVGIADDRDKISVHSEFKGYISSFGAAVIQSGILPALIFFEDKGGAQKDRPKLLQAIMKMNNWETPNGKGDLSLVKHYRSATSAEKSKLEMRILQDAVALKLALRTFKFVDKE